MSVSARLVHLALEQYTLGRTPSQEPYAVAKGSHIAKTLRGQRDGLSAPLAAAYADRYGTPPTTQGVTDAIRALEGQAQRATAVETHLRVAEYDGVTYVDLGDEACHVLVIDSRSWSVVTEGVPIRFRRTNLTRPLPLPGRDGPGIAALWRRVAVSPADRPLVLAWLLAALIAADIPHPILALVAEQGSGKSTATTTLIDLIDPSAAPLRKPPPNPDDWVTAASASWCVALDNLSAISTWFSDALCRAVTGEGDVRRTKYTDADVTVFSFRRCIIANGIDLGSIRGDLADRLLAVEIEPLAERRTEVQLKRMWDTDIKASVLADLLDLAVRIRCRLETAPTVIDVPRLADFATIVAAVDAELGTTSLERYRSALDAAAHDSLDSDPFIAALASSHRGFVGATASQIADEVVRPLHVPARLWPSTPQAVGARLHRAAPALRRAGWTALDYRDPHLKARLWTLSPPRGGTGSGS